MHKVVFGLWNDSPYAMKYSPHIVVDKFVVK